MTALWDLAARGELTVGDLPDDVPGVRLELVDGSLTVTPQGDYEHQLIITELVARLVTASLPPELAVLAGVNVIRGTSTLLIPDLAVVDPSHLAMDGLGVSPEGVRLAVEVTSRSTRVRDLTTKRELYRQWNIPYLIVDRATRPPALRVESDLPEWADVLLK